MKNILILASFFLAVSTGIAQDRDAMGCSGCDAGDAKCCTTKGGSVYYGKCRC